MTLFTENLNLFYDKKQILHNINLSINSDAINAIIGANGSGKTSFLKCIVGLLGYNGVVKIDDVDIKSYSRNQFAKTVAFLSQKINVVQSIDVKEFLLQSQYSYNRNYHKLDIEKDDNIMNAIDLTGISKFMDAKLNEMSGGEQQLIRLAYTIAQNTPIMVFDEPISFLDIKHQITILDVIKKTQKKLNNLVILTIHDINYAINYANNIIVMKGGAVYKSGTPYDVVTEQTLKETYGVEYATSSVNQDGLTLWNFIKLS